MRKVLLGCLLMLLAGTAASGVYRWLDAQGKVHYGDCPPPECASEAVDLPPAPSQEQTEQSRERVERWIEEQEQRAAQRRAEEQREELEASRRAQQRDRRSAALRDARCFSPAAQLVGERGQAGSGPVLVRSLTDAELSAVQRMFDAIRGQRWRGEMREIQCLGRPEAPSVKHVGGQVRMEADWRWGGSFTLDLDVLSDEGSHVTRLIQLFLEDGYLRKDYSRGDVEILQLGNEALAFFNKYRQASQPRGVRRGGPERIDLLSLELVPAGLRIQELFYVNGLLSTSRIVELSP